MDNLLFIPCENCKNKKGPKPGYFYEKDERGFTLIKECECHKNWKNQKDLEIRLKKANLTSDFSFSDYKGAQSLEDLEALKMIGSSFEKFKYRKCFYLSGTNGTQKTSMVTALGKELLKQGYSVKYVLMRDLIDLLIPSFSNENDEERALEIKRCLNYDFLIIDESFDKSKVTLYNSGYQIPFLDSFLRTRLDINKKSILFVSNKEPNQIAEQGFGDSLQNFVERNTQESHLIFKDVYIKERNRINRLGLFSRGDE